MRHGSLFSGIGGFDLAAEWMGWENVFHCEWNEFCQKVLKYYWPKAISYGDITKTDFTIWRGRTDIVTGGFPCQPYSQAGKRKGKADERHLWPEMLRAIREIQPRWVVGENVPGLLNWEGGMVLDEIKADLEATGFEVFPPLVLPACGKNAPHKRERLWIVAYCSEVDGKQIAANGERQNCKQIKEGRKVWGQLTPVSKSGNPTNAKCQGLQREDGLQKPVRPKSGVGESDWDSWPTESPVCGGDDGLPTELDGLTISKHRQSSIMAYGNSIVPQVVFEIFKAIEKTIQSCQ